MASKSNIEDSDWARAPPPALPASQRLSRIFYNPDDKSVFGRTAKRWGIVLTFYLIFYAVLALMFAACMAGLLSTIDSVKPKYLLGDSLIGANPGVAFMPVPKEVFDKNPPKGEVVVLKYAADDASTFDYYINNLTFRLEPYATAKMYTDKEGCNTEDSFGYPHTPCIFIKLNKLYDWEPVTYDNSTDLPEDMPEDLVSYIRDETETQLKQVWISCWEEHSNETEIEYPWGRGLPSQFYPYRNSKGYLSPLLPIRIKPPKNSVVVIRCRAWAKNIIYSKSIKEPRGYTRIHLCVEETLQNNSTLTS